MQHMASPHSTSSVLTSSSQPASSNPPPTTQQQPPQAPAQPIQLGLPSQQQHPQGNQPQQHTQGNQPQQQQHRNQRGRNNQGRGSNQAGNQIGETTTSHTQPASSMPQPVDNRPEKRYNNKHNNKHTKRDNTPHETKSITEDITTQHTTHTNATPASDHDTNTTDTTDITNNNSNNNNKMNNNRNKNNRNHKSGEKMNNKYTPKTTATPTSTTSTSPTPPTSSATSSAQPSGLSPFAPVFIPGSMGPPSSISSFTANEPQVQVASSPSQRDNRRPNRNNSNSNLNALTEPGIAPSPSTSRNNKKQSRPKGPKHTPSDPGASNTATTTTTTTETSAATPTAIVSLPTESIANSPQPGRSHRGPASTRPQHHRRQHSHDSQLHEHSHPSHEHGSTPNTPTNRPKHKHAANNNTLKKQSRGVNADDMPSTIGDHTMLASKIIVKLNQNAYECMVCYDTVSRKSDVWWCSFCYALFHLKCIDEWSSRSYSEGSKLGWRCPGCQHVYNNAPECTCFCGKTRSPDFNPYFIPHSCGENCGKARGVDCPHPCPLLCHPGPCPPCMIAGKHKKCFCGKEPYRLKCGEVDKGMTCGNTCDKPLKCSKHRCQLDCHPGPCSTCQVIEEQRCYCGAATQKKLCGTGIKDLSQGQERVYSCGSVCDRRLSCGNHNCRSVCHTGACADCDLLPKTVTTCPCGSSPLSVTRTSCTDPIPTCSNTCNKLLPCGKHSCPQQCHTGPCPPCQERVLVRCRCQSTSAALLCNEVANAPPDAFLCNAICKRQKSCGQHICGVRCCPSAADLTDPIGNHVCIQSCNKPLKCGVHTCPQLCHKGRCRRCTNVSFDELPCACGRTVTYPPVVCGTPLPRCPHPCTLPRPCGHVSSITHECHPGDCPPCVVLVDRVCVGGHTTRRNVRCSQLEVSCGFPCGKKLQCGDHVCTRICHNGPCYEELPTKKKKKNKKPKQGVEGTGSGDEESETGQSQEGEFGEENAEPPPTCGRLCLAKLSTCEHLCQSVCHPGKQCPTGVCKQITKVRCACGRRVGEAVCNHNGDGILTGSEAQPLQCDDVCEVEIRNKKLAEALGITSTHDKAPQYSDLLINLVKASPVFVKKLEQSFEELINNPVNTTKLNLPIMDRVKRQLVHELAKYYRLETVSIDKEPVRSVIVSRTRDSKIPSVILSEYVAPARFGPTTTTTTTTPLQRRGPGVLHIYNLQSYVKTNHLVAFLQSYAGQYRLQWVDDANCLAIFNDELAMRAALSDLSGGMFSIKAYKDIDNPETPTQPVVLSQGPTREKKLTAKMVQAEEESWRHNDNTFAALGSVDADGPPTTTTTTTTTTLATTADSSTPTSWEDAWRNSSDSVAPSSDTTVDQTKPTVPSQADSKPIEAATTSTESSAKQF